MTNSKLLPQSRASFLYATGTGNSRRVAEWLAADFTVGGVGCATAEMKSAGPGDLPIAGQSHLLGLVFPTHAFTAPWSVIRFVASLPNGRGTAAAVFPTRGGTRIMGAYLPGLEGTGGYLIAAMLAVRGYSVRVVQAIDMPANWTVIHPALSDDAVTGVERRARDRVRDLSGEILGGRRHLGGRLPFALGLLLAPASVGYNLVGRFFLAKLFYASNDCTSCGLCSAECPRHAIKMRSITAGAVARPYWTVSCENCMRCMHVCPERAVEASYPLAAALMAATSVPIGALALGFVARRAGFQRAGRAGTLVSIANYLAKPVTVAVLYCAFWALSHIPIVNRILTATTPTHYFRRYSRTRL